MNKKLILLGAAAIVACFVLTSFDKKTLAQQKEEIAAAVAAQLDSLKLEKEIVCTETVNVEATTRYNAWVEIENAKPAVGGKKRTIKKATPSGPKVDPLPETPPPPPPSTADPKKSKIEGAGNTSEKASKIEGASNTDKKKAKMGGGGN